MLYDLSEEPAAGQAETAQTRLRSAQAEAMRLGLGCEVIAGKSSLTWGRVRDQFSHSAAMARQ